MEAAGKGAMEEDVFDLLEKLWVMEVSSYPRRVWEEGIGGIARLLKMQPTLRCKVLGGMVPRGVGQGGVLA